MPLIEVNRVDYEYDANGNLLFTRRYVNNIIVEIISHQPIDDWIEKYYEQGQILSEKKYKNRTLVSTKKYYYN